MRIAIFLFMILVVSYVWAGTFIDNFEGGNLDSWAESDPWGKTASWSVKNGELVGISTAGDGGDTKLYLLGSCDWQDYDISARVKVTECFSKNICGAGLLVRQITPEQYLEFKILLHDGHAGQDVPKARYAWVDKVDWDVIHKEPLDLQFDAWYSLMVEASGNHFSFYVDGEMVIDCESTLFDSGEVGVVLNGAEAHYDDFVVTGDEIPDSPIPDLSTAVDPNGKLATSWSKLKRP